LTYLIDADGKIAGRYQGEPDLDALEAQIRTLLSQQDQKRLDVMTSCDQDTRMERPKRSTIYFSADVHKALRLRAAASDRSVSDMVNDAVRTALAEVAADLEAFSNRVAEKSVSFESFVAGLKRRGRI
jgi:hypothetical protein